MIVPYAIRLQLHTAANLRSAQFIAAEMHLSVEVLKRIVDGLEVDENIAKHAEKWVADSLEWGTSTVRKTVPAIASE